MARPSLLLRLLTALLCGLCAAPAAARQAGPPAAQDERAAQQRPGVPPAPIVVEAELVGLRSYDEARVLRLLGIEVGKPFPVQRPGVQRVWETYKIIVREPVVEAVPGGVKVTIEVQEMPVDLEPRFVGNKRVKTERLREWAQLFDQAHVYLHEAERIRRRLITGYKRHGYAHVEIDIVTGGPEEGLVDDVIFEIREGPRVRVRGIRVRGNEHIPDTGWGFWRGGLRRLAEVKTKGKGIFRWFGGLYDREVLDADLVAMRQVYRDRGWLDVKVDIEDLDYNDERNRVTVNVVVDEGPLWHVADVDVVGIERDADGVEREVPLYFPKEEMLEDLELRPGVAYERARVLHDRRALATYYGERGYPEKGLFADRESVGFEFQDPPQLLYDFERKEVTVTYRLVQGRLRTIREVRISGNAATNDKVVRRQISVLEGEIANVKEIQRSLSRVRSTGYFEDMRDPRHNPPDVVLHDVPGDPDLVDMEFRVEEGRVVDFNLSGGVTSDAGVVGLLQLNMRNFQASDPPSGLFSSFGEIYRKEALHGNGESFGIDLSPGSEVNFWRVAYQHPDLFGTHFNRYSGRVEFVARDRIFRSHDEERIRGQFTIARLFGQGDLSFRFGPVWQEVDIKDLDKDDDLPATLEDSEGESVFQGLYTELRRSQLDNRLSPSQGSYLAWSNTLFGGPFGGDEDTWESEVIYDRYFQLGSEEDDIRPGIYLGGAIGVAHPFGDTDFVNYSERFFLGGSSTLRGFDFRGVGPNDGDYASGGETVARFSAEYRYPLYATAIPGTSRRQEMFRLILFTDWGVLDPDSFQLDLDEYRATAGFAFGLVQPIPLTFNFGWPLREGDGDDTEVFSFRLSFR